MERAVELFKKAYELHFTEKKPEAAFIMYRHILKNYPDFKQKSVVYQMIQVLGNEELDFCKINIEEFPEEDRPIFEEVLAQIGIGAPQPLARFTGGGHIEEIVPITLEHLDRYGEIYARAFSGEPWNDPWKPEDAKIHVRELLEMKQSYGLEYTVDGEVAGFILGGSMLFHYGRTFEINDLAVDPAYQRRGIARKLMDTCLSELKKQGIVGVHLITAGEGILPEFYESFGFSRETRVILMGAEL